MLYLVWVKAREQVNYSLMYALDKIEDVRYQLSFLKDQYETIVVTRQEIVPMQVINPDSSKSEELLHSFYQN